MNRAFPGAGIFLLLIRVFVECAWAAPPVVLGVDMPALIDRAADRPERFAVDIPHRVSISADGEWSATAGARVWSFAVQVPTAVSLSFHASLAVLPSSAVLTVTGTRASVTYRARDIVRGGLWSRPLVGDTLKISVSVAPSQVSLVQLQIESVQAGYRGLGGVPDHPYFARLVREGAAAATTQSCTENYSCNATTANQGPAHATVAVLVADQYQCTGTLLNNTRNDFTPYVLTARHCENGVLGGGAPQAASSITVYWDAVTPCGATLGSIYDGTAPAQGGATTIVEQQDAWLVQLDAAPVVNDAFWAGWDATGGVFVGGYSIHHALGYNKQYAGWYGQALAQTISRQTLNIGYDSNLWGLVNQVGSVGAGASGGAVFDPNNRVVGSATFAALQNGANSAGVCPVSTPAAPAPSTITAQYTSLAAVFASTADSTSTTGNATVQSILDPIKSGNLTNDGAAVLPVTLTASNTSPNTFQSLTLSWNVAGAQSCTASGGVSGDGWAGAKSANGSATITNYTGGQVTYSLTCSNGNLIGTSTVNVSWFLVVTYVSLLGPPTPVMLGGAVYLSWSPNVSPCVASGGANGDGWAGPKSAPGQQNVPALQLGSTTYTLTCGTGAQTATEQVTVTVVPLSVTLTANATQLRIGSQVTLHWAGPGTGDACSTSGGGAGDQWGGQTNQNSEQSEFITETRPGSYTYTITCNGGGQTVSSSAKVVFTNAAPSVSLTAVSPTQGVYPATGTVTPTTDLLWSSNISGCSLGVIGPESNTLVTLQGNYPTGTAADVERMAGSYTYVLDCFGYQASASIEWTTSTPALTLATPTTTWAANEPYTLSWSTNTEPCTQTGGSPGDGWAGNYSPGQAQQTVTETQAGSYTFTLTCGIGSSAGQAQLTVTVPPPSVTISATPTSISQYSTVQLNWNSTVAPCSAAVPGATSWAGNDIDPTGSTPIIESAVGTFTYAISCGSGTSAVQASTQVTVGGPVPTTLSVSAATAAVETAVTLTWNSAASDVCTATGGGGSDGWMGTLNSSGSMQVTSSSVGTITYGINCNNTTAQTQVTYTAPNGTLSNGLPPSVQLSSSVTTQVVGQSVALKWASQHANSCAAAGGVPGDGWTGSLPLTGTMQMSESSAGSDTYQIVCTGLAPAAQAEVSIDFTTASTSSSGSGSSGSSKSGGGGAIDELLLVFLSLVLLLRPFRMDSY
jgi:hypothetical protein